ncbi:hypothetical protein AK812_SmicGene5798 [Symbiodinium microadriaticum]|uniref:SMB domain-containing protein n=1 Tax=Symbiodinium microadriaticum TaxID=2951 RepID=A0A1Q9ESU3_SYMMI|nr:hypothetical protein AK812_SmicGene35960 [Symbiodinium microadriaticum]OLQ10486.1 hypothetical protein AK812_SmicGene5798 [Symbiodinium microadriaticum]CAE7254666.1 unnamed protein product [Symbiodinium microadriaticum]CAE7316174.1 unnamed protein product [Symbiodinium sp. KB8]
MRGLYSKLGAGLSIGLLILGWFVFVVLTPTEEATTQKREGQCDRLKGLNRSQASCDLFGGCHGYCPGNPCQCTSQCNNFGNCCGDFVESCMNESHVDYVLAKREEELQEMEHGQGIVGREWILSLVMFFFVLTMMALLYFAHSQNKHMQNAVYELMCTTVSIFATNTVTVAVHGVLIEQLWMGKYPGLNQKAGPIVQAKIYGILSILCFLGSNWIIYRFREKEHEYTALGQLSSHMTGFTLIQAIGRLQWSVREDGWKCCLVLPWTAILLRGMLFVGERLRAQCVGDEEVYWEYQAGDDEWHKFPVATSRELESRFMDSSDSESEVVFSIPVSDPADPRQKVEVSLPNANAICESPHGEMFPEGDGSDLSCAAWKVRRECPWLDFAREIFIEGAALVMGFLVMQTILLFHTGYLHSVEGLLQKPKDWDWVLTGKVLGWSLVFGSFVPVVAASSAWIPARFLPDAELLRESCSSALAWCLVRGAALFVRPHCSIMDTYIVVAFPLTWLAFVVTGFVYSIPSGDTKSTMVPHSIANAFGIVVGLAWDKAFESLAVHMTSGWYGHYVVSKVCLAGAVILTILPGWYWYLVPHTLRSQGH